jgi:hypothetical protein
MATRNEEFRVSGVIGAALAPVLAAAGAVAALVTECIILVEREDQPNDKKTS